MRVLTSRSLASGLGGWGSAFGLAASSGESGLGSGDLDFDFAFGLGDGGGETLVDLFSTTEVAIEDKDKRKPRDRVEGNNS